MRKIILIAGFFHFFLTIASKEISAYNPSSTTERRFPNLRTLQRKQKEFDSSPPPPLGQFSRAKLGRPAPGWKGTAVINGTFQEISSADYSGKYLILLFYPLDFTFVCPTEIHAFNDRISELRKLNTEVVAVSVDSQFAHLAWINTPPNEGGLGNISIPLLSDLSHEISKAYGVYAPEVNHAHRGLFIIDPKGIVRHVTLNDVHVGRNVDETVRLVQAYQQTDDSNEVCPAGWRPGEKTITVTTPPPNPCNTRSQEDTEPEPRTRKFKSTTLSPKLQLQCKKCEDIARKQKDRFLDKRLNLQRPEWK